MDDYHDYDYDYRDDDHDALMIILNHFPPFSFSFFIFTEDLFLFSTMNHPAPRGRPPEDLNGKGWSF